GWKCAQRALSPLHIEAEAFIWTMSEVINQGYNGQQQINFCADSLAKGGRSRVECVAIVDDLAPNRYGQVACLNGPE
ncbi:hypothetical protein HID58_034539, partial [Brassica napus]